MPTMFVNDLKRSMDILRKYRCTLRAEFPGLRAMAIGVGQTNTSNDMSDATAYAKEMRKLIGGLGEIS